MLHPIEPLPRLTGCGIHVRDSTPNAADPLGDYHPIRPTIPGVEVARPDGARAWLCGDDVTVVEHPDGYEVNAPDVTTWLNPVEVYEAAYQVRNLIEARLWAARQAKAIVEDAADEAWGCALARALRGAA